MDLNIINEFKQELLLIICSWKIHISYTTE